MYKKCFARKLKDNTYKISLWTDNGYEVIEWENFGYKECNPSEATHTGLNGEYLKKTLNWTNDDEDIHFNQITPYQKFLIEKYGTNDTPSVTHKELFFDIEIEMGDALTPEYIKSAPKKVTSIAWYDKQADEWAILILDPKNQITSQVSKNKEIISCLT